MLIILISTASRADLLLLVRWRSSVALIWPVRLKLVSIFPCLGLRLVFCFKAILISAIKLRTIYLVGIRNTSLWHGVDQWLLIVTCSLAWSSCHSRRLGVMQIIVCCRGWSRR